MALHGQCKAYGNRAYPIASLFRLVGSMSGCFNRPPLHNPDWPGRAPIPFRMSLDCEYTKSDLGQKDKGCLGCAERHTIDPVIPVIVEPVTTELAKWEPMSSCSQGKSVLLLGEGGLPTVGRYIRGSQDFWQGWAELPVKRAEVEA